MLAPRLLVAFGEQRERYGSAAEMQQYAGIAPVTGAQRQAILGALAVSVPEVLASNVCRVGDGVDPLFLLGASLLRAPTRQRGLASGGGSSPRVQMDSDRVSLLANRNTLQ